MNGIVNHLGGSGIKLSDIKRLDWGNGNSDHSYKVCELNESADFIVGCYDIGTNYTLIEQWSYSNQTFTRKDRQEYGTLSGYDLYEFYGTMYRYGGTVYPIIRFHYQSSGSSREYDSNFGIILL